MGSLLGPTKRNARLKWSVQCDTTLVNQDRILKNVPQRRGPSGMNLTLEEQTARVMLTQEMTRRQGTVWIISGSKSLTFPEEMSQVLRREFSVRMESAVIGRTTELKTVQAGYKTVTDNAVNRMKAMRQATQTAVVEGEMQAIGSICLRTAADRRSQAFVAGRDRDTWGNAQDLLRVKARTGATPEIIDRMLPTAEWGWRTGADVLAGRLTTLEEALDKWQACQAGVTPDAGNMSSTVEGDEEMHQSTGDPESSVPVDDLDLMVPEAGWGTTKRRMDPRIFEGEVGACLMLEDLVNHIQTMGF